MHIDTEESSPGLLRFKELWKRPSKLDLEGNKQSIDNQNTSSLLGHRCSNGPCFVASVMLVQWKGTINPLPGTKEYIFVV